MDTEDRWDDVVDAIRSGESDQVNTAIDDIGDLDLESRVRLFDVGFEEVTNLYADSDDGYVRQSAVRVVEEFATALSIIIMTEREQEFDYFAVETYHDSLDALYGFFLEAIQDDDGRVRNAAKRGLKDVYRTYSMCDSHDLDAVIAELAEMADQYSGTRRKHILETIDDAMFFNSPVEARFRRQ